MSTVKTLKVLAHRNNRSMEQEVREIIKSHVGDRQAALKLIRAAWKKQKRSPQAAEIDAWIRSGQH